MKRWNIVILLMIVLMACAGCAGAVSNSDSDNVVQPGQPDIIQNEDRTENLATGNQPPEEQSGVPEQQSEKQGSLTAGSNQTASGTDVVTGTATETGEEKNDIPDNDGEAAKNAGAPESMLTLWVTKDFAQSKLHEGDVVFTPGDSVMDILKNNLEIETGYGGGFVQSINGLSSGYTGADKKTRDWFYYANGIITSVGALDYKPAPGDIIWWDYHDWGGAAFTPALIGAFPEPFASGYRGQNPGTVILTAPGSEQYGQQLAGHLRKAGVNNVAVQPYDEKILTTGDKITLVVGLWEHFTGEGYWQGLQKQRQKTGLFIEFAPDYFATLDINGKVVDRYTQNAGAIIATGSGMGDPTPVWLVTGLDQAGLDLAVDTLITRPESVKQCFGALVSGGKVIAVPVVN